VTEQVLHKIITKAGDGGSTNLVYTEVHKSDEIIECIGSIDEANSCIGYARHELQEELGQYSDILDKVQNNLFDLGADLICNTEKVGAEYIANLEQEANKINANLAPIKSFIIPKGKEAVLHKARAVVRRAERDFWRYAKTKGEVNTLPGVYLNRLSDLLFIMCRAIHNPEQDEELWVRIK